MSYSLIAHSGTSGGALSAAGADNVFGKATINTELSDQDSIVTLSNNEFTLAVGIYRIRAKIGFGCQPYMTGVQAKAGLYSITNSAFKNYIGGALEIIGTAGVTPTIASGQLNGWIEIYGRFQVVAATEVFAIYMAGKSGAAVWYNDSTAQGVGANSISSGSKPSYFKLIEILKE